MRLYVTVLLAALLALAGVLLGWWWAAFPVAFAMGVVVGRARFALPAGAGLGLLAWLIPLVVAQARYGLGPTATSLAAIMGLDRQPALPVLVSLIVGTLLGFTGAWLGSAARSVLVPPSPTGERVGVRGPEQNNFGC
jgi:hypothetical protein